ncbi:10-formyltetrahydrofolate:L-methionyl-tRNA(fMet) N-formyltransferase [Candidatus Sulfopaludibacter sp. SbA4]|nr:10-formyltetrahydrofolate:L-methionyl-tRNA(fMet) N-formyltransferase [Candidatus Sulfopaludibacter sp. SbA4]
MRLVFLGTPAFAVPTLERIVEAGHTVLAVVTQPDRPRGRGQNPAASPVKEAALRLGLPVYQPERVRRPEAVEYLRSLAADAMVVVGYGQIIPQSVIDLVPDGIINVHASLLPKYRGAGPIQWAIIRGETRTGVTTMRIDAGLDTGDMLLAAETEIAPGENAVDLGRRLAVMGADLLVETLARLADGTIVPQEQDPAQATYAPLLKKEDGLIDWRQPASAIHNRVRGLQPWPGAYTTFRGQTLHIWGSRQGPDSPKREGHRGRGPGCVSLRPLGVACGEGTLELLEVQLEGRKRMSAADFANGQRLSENEILGEPRT